MIVFATGLVSETVITNAAGRSLRPCEPTALAPLTALVLTGHESLRARLRAVIVGRGAVCRAPASVAAAWRAAGADHRLVFVDIARPLAGQLDDARAIAETLAQRQGVLLAVCGRPGRADQVPPGGDDEECWARQMGAFVFLPGVGSDAGVDLIVAEATRIFRGGG